MNNINSHLKHYQIKSIEMAKKYILSKSKKNCLIKLPTGTGKTGVMAVISNQFAGNVLIIVPNATLPKQTSKEISEEFWYNIGYNPSTIKKTQIICGHKSSIKFDEKEDAIYIVTIQTLLSIYENNKALFALIKENISLLLYDEGHREPAIIWSDASRELSKKTILFTATPYRNDNYIFKIDKAFTYKYSMKEAIEKGHVKEPKFIAIPTGILADDKQIIKFILNATKDKETKSLIRCKNSDRIKLLVKELNKSIPSIGCHSTFSNNQNFLNSGRKVLEDKDTYPIIVHCDMLIEGVNIPKLNTLFLLDGFNNTKTTIQQIGRVLRPTFGKIASIYVPEYLYDEIYNQWELYIKSEQDEDEDNYIYINGKFREKFDLENNDNIYEAIRFQAQANIYVCDYSLFARLKVSIIEGINRVGNLESLSTSFFIEGNLWILCYQRKEPSKILISNYCFDYSLEYVSLVEIESNNKFYYFYYNSRRYILPDESEDVKYISRESILKLIPEGSEIRNVKYTSTSHTKIGARTKALDGISLNSMPGSLTERMSFCRNVTGYYLENEKRIDRYMSSITSRISERRECNYLEYIEWCKKIIQEISSNKQNVYLLRFAKISNPPTTQPTSILIDFNIELTKCGENVCIESKFCKIDNHKFEFIIESKKITGTIVADKKQERIRLQIEGLEEYWVEVEHIPLNKYIEKNNFYVYYADEQIMYFQRNYFKPNIKFSYVTVDEFEMWKNIISVVNLNKCKNEKFGEAPDLAFNSIVRWPIDSIFGTLVNEIETNPIYSNINYLICDDLRNEIADFIALNTIESKIIFIHCKHGDGLISASAFQDVCGQAVKNIEYAITMNPETLRYFNNHVILWKEKWSLKKEKAGKAYKTDRCIKGDVDAFVKEYKRLLQNPNATKEVWLVTSGLSKEALKKELLKKKQAEQFQQLMFILHSTQDSLSQAGVTMKIICKN